MIYPIYIIYSQRTTKPLGCYPP